MYQNVPKVEDEKDKRKSLQFFRMINYVISFWLNFTFTITETCFGISAKPSLMEIFSVDMTLRRDSQYHNNNHLHPHRHHQQEHLQIHHTL
jgi:hypothetical protein